MKSDARLGARLLVAAREQGFDAAGIAPLRPSDHAAFYREWLRAGRHGDMHYLSRADAVTSRTDPTSRWPELRCALVVALRYDRPESEDENVDPSRGIIARYARGRDYHRTVKQKLVAVLRWLEDDIGRALPLARAYVDTGAVLERELAQRAGLGWFGRNTMLLHPRRGSWFFLGSLLLDLDLAPDAPFERDHCGRCNACVDACPTGALLGRDENGAPVMDARLCISYLTIEHRGPIPHALRPLIGNRVFGCDICQEVCPFNIKLARESTESGHAVQSASAVAPGTRAPALVELLEIALDENRWDAFSRGSAIRRAGRAGFARNVCVAIGNWLAGLEAPPGDALAVLRKALGDPEPLVREHAAWALERCAAAPRHADRVEFRR